MLGLFEMNPHAIKIDYKSTEMIGRSIQMRDPLIGVDFTSLPPSPASVSARLAPVLYVTHVSARTSAPVGTHKSYEPVGDGVSINILDQVAPTRETTNLACRLFRRNMNV